METALGVPIVVVDYTDVDGLSNTLDALGVHTIISAMSNYDDFAGNKPRNVELIRAAEASKTTRRILSSHWAAPYSEK